MTSTVRAAVAGGLAALGLRALVIRGVVAKLQRDLDALNTGDAGPLLKGYADDAVLIFNEGDHRWAGVHDGKPAIAAFLRDYLAAGVQGEIVDFWMTGPPWAARIVVRFDDHADGPDGTRLYANRTCLVFQTRWGRIVRHEDFYEDTGRILEFEQALRDMGRERVA
jgi:ketosteroid isomerase-like protein